MKPGAELAQPAMPVAASAVEAPMPALGWRADLVRLVRALPGKQTPYWTAPAFMREPC